MARSPLCGAIKNSRATAPHHAFHAIAFTPFLDQFQKALALQFAQMVVHFLPRHAETAGEPGGGIGLGQLFEQAKSAGLE